MARAERVLYEKALGIEGLEHEIALLRVRLNEALKETPVDVEAFTRLLRALTQAVAVQYRLSPKARKHLADAFAETLNRFADQLVPAEGER